MKKGFKLILIIMILAISLSFVGCGLGNIIWGDGEEEPRELHTLTQSVNILNNSKVSVNTIDNSTLSPMSVSEVVEKVADSVVEINTVISSNSGAAGSGVLFATNDTRYFIITNEHVVSDAMSITVILTDGTRHNAGIVSSDYKNDIAVISILKSGVDTDRYTTVTVPSDSYKIRAGDTAIAIGNPLGSLGGTVTTGIVSALDREIYVEDRYMTLLQTDAAINSGNSGGALFDCYGQLIGIVNAKAADVGIEGIGFAIPVKTAVSTACDLIIEGHVTGRPAIGITVVAFSSASQIYQFSHENNWKEFFDYTGDAIGLYVKEVSNLDSGLQEGDYIVSADGVTVTTQIAFSKVINSHKAGEQLQLQIRRKGELMNISVTLIEAA